MGVAFAQLGAFADHNSRVLKTLFVGIACGFVGYHMLAPALYNSFFSTIGSPLNGIQWMTALAGGILAAVITYKIAGKFAGAQSKRVIEIDETARMLSSKEAIDVSKVKGLTGYYLWFLHSITKGITGNLVILVIAGAITYATITLFSQNAKGVEFFVDEEPDIALLFISARGNLSGKDIRDLSIDVENQVLKVRGIDNIVMTVTAPGGGGGGGVDPSQPQDLPADVVGSITIELANYSDRRRAVEIFAEIRERTANIPGIKIELRKLEGGPPTGKDVRLEVKSTNYEDMVAAITRVREKLDTMNDLQEVEDDRPLPGIDWQLTVDREEAGRYNASIPTVGAMIQLITNGTLIGTSNPDDSDDSIDIRVRLPEEQRALDRLSELRLRTANGQVPISNFIKMEAKQKVTSIKRRDGLYAMDIKANLLASLKAEGLTPDDKVKEIQTWIDEQEWKENIFLKFRGADEEQKESGEFLAKAGAAALFLMFIILVTQYNSFYQTFLTLSTVILAVIGVLIGMMLTGQKFSIIMTGTGVIALAGIVVNNAIVLIDTYNRLREEGASVHDAVLKTSAQRMRPIMLTTVTTIMGLVPMALSINLNFFAQTITVGSITAIWWVQLSTAIISGLAFSTLLTLILIPVMLTLPTNIVNLFSRKRVAVSQTEEIAVEDDEAAIAASNVTQMPKKKKAPIKKSARSKTSKSSPDEMLEAAE